MTILDHKLNRRVFLATSSAAVAVVCVGGSLQGCGAGASQPPGRYDTMLTAGDVPAGTAKIPANADYIVARDANGYYAYSNVCTHQGCALSTATQGESVCPCHGARFDGEGNNIAGPGNRGNVADLAHYEVSFVGTGDTAAIWVDTSVTVTDRSTRVNPTAAA